MMSITGAICGAGRHYLVAFQLGLTALQVFR
jgi:hypothetical protein